MTNEQYLQMHRAWNWVWPSDKPGKRNCMPGPASKPKGPQNGYTQARRRKGTGKPGYSRPNRTYRAGSSR